MPLYRRLPKKGFNNSRFKVVYSVVNLKTLTAFADGEKVTPRVLRERGLIKSLRLPLKVLGNGDIQVPLTVRAHKISSSAARKIEKAAGKVEVIS